MLPCSKYKGFSKSLYKMSSAGKNRSFSISVTRESSTFILQYIVVLISTTEPENMSPQLHLGVKLSPMLVFGSRNCVQAAIPIVIYYRNRRLDAVLGATIPKCPRQNFDNEKNVFFKTFFFGTCTPS